MNLTAPVNSTELTNSTWLVNSTRTTEESIVKRTSSFLLDASNVTQKNVLPPTDCLSCVAVTTDDQTFVINTNPHTQSSVVAVAVAVTIIIIIIIAVVITLVLLIRRRQRLRKKESNFVKMENPQYNSGRDQLTFSHFPMESTLHRGHPVMLQEPTNGDVNRHSLKQEAPPPPIYQPKNNNSKRLAPVVSKTKYPAPVAEPDLYEKDSTSSRENLEITAVSNQNHRSSPVKTTPDVNQQKSPRASLDSQPLIKDASPKVESRGQKRPAPIHSPEEEVQEEDADPRASLIGKAKSGSNMSLDSYDKTKNPFFMD